MSKAVPDLIKDLAEWCSDGGKCTTLDEDPATLRQMSKLLDLAKHMVDWKIEQLEEERKREAWRKTFKEALVAGDLKKMKRAHRKLGSPDLSDYRCNSRCDALDIFLESREESGTFNDDTFDVSEHLAWLQSVGARNFCYMSEDLTMTTMETKSALISQGLDMTGTDLMECWGDGQWMMPGLFTHPKGDKDFILSFLKTGAGMWPLDLPGASADNPPAGAYDVTADSSGDLMRSPDGKYVPGDDWDLRTLFWPDHFPRHGDGLVFFPPVEEIRESVTAVCSFFADKRETERRERREAAWRRRRLVVLCANRVEGGPKRHKAAALTGLGALVRGVTAQQLWRTVVSYL